MTSDERQRLIAASLRVAEELERQARAQREAAARLMRRPTQGDRHE